MQVLLPLDHLLIDKAKQLNTRVDGHYAVGNRLLRQRLCDRKAATLLTIHECLPVEALMSYSLCEG